MESEPLLLLFPGGQKDRLRRAARAAGKSLSQYVRDAVTKQINEDEEIVRARREGRETKRASTGPVGLFRHAIGPFNKHRDDTDDAPAAPTINVNVGRDGDGHIDLGQLAAYVVESKSSGDRETRLVEVAKLLAHGHTDDAAKKRAQALDDAIEKLDRQKRERPEETGGALGKMIAKIVGGGSR